MVRFASISAVTLALCTLQGVTPAIHITERTPQGRDITATFALAPQEILYADFLDFSTNHQELRLSPWQSDHPPVSFFDSTFQRTMRGFKNTVTLNLQAYNAGALIENEAAYVTYLTNTDRKPQQMVIPLAFGTPAQALIQPQENSIPLDSVSTKTTAKKASVERSLRYHGPSSHE